MFYTARQLESLLKETGKLVLPYRARLTPNAQDFVRLKKLTVGYSDVEQPKGQFREGSQYPVLSKPYLWWCDGPCGSAKAALMNAARETKLEAMAILEDSSRAFAAVRHLSQAIADGTAAGGVLIAKHAAAATVYANRCQSLRAIVGTGLPAVEAGINEVSANALILEIDQLSLREMTHLILRFIKAPRKTNEAMLRELKELIHS